MSILSNDALSTLIMEVSPIPGVAAADIQASTALLSEGLIDSLGLLQIVEAIEAGLGRKIPPALITIDNFNSLQAMAALQDKVAATSVV